MGFLGAVSSYFHKKGFENLSSDERIGLIDKGAMRILRAFHEDGFEAFIVGGCVRDLMMKLEPHDWDITTAWQKAADGKPLEERDAALEQLSSSLMA